MNVARIVTTDHIIRISGDEVQMLRRILSTYSEHHAEKVAPDSAGHFCRDLLAQLDDE